MGEKVKDLRIYAIIWALYALFVAGLLLGNTSSARAEFSPEVDFQLSATDGDGAPPAPADSVPVFRTVITQENDEDRMSNFKVIFPEGWKVNNVGGDMIGHCLLERGRFTAPYEDGDGNEDRRRNQCPDNSSIGYVRALVEDTLDENHGEYPGAGYVYLLESDQLLEPVKLGIYLNMALSGGESPFAIYGYISLDGEVGHERIVGYFYAIPEQFEMRRFEMVLTNAPNGRGLIRTPLNCGLQRFDVEIESYGTAENNWMDSEVSRDSDPSPPQVDGDCDRQRPQMAREFEPEIDVEPSTRAAGASPDTLKVTITGNMNNGSQGYESLKEMTLRLPQGMAGNLFPFARSGRCPANMPSLSWAFGRRDPCEDFKVGTVTATVQAAQQEHIVDGNIYLANHSAGSNYLGDLRIVFPKPPVRLNPLYADESQECANAGGEYNFNDLLCPNPLALNARLFLDPMTYRIEAVVTGLPRTYEIRSIDMIINGMPDGAVRPFITNPTSCGERSFDADFISDRETSVSASASYRVTDCNLPFTPSFRFMPFEPEARGENTTPSRAGGAAIIVNQPNGQAYMHRAEYTLAVGYRANSLLDGVVPCEEEDVAGCGGSRGQSYIGYAIARTPALDGAPRSVDTELYGPLHLMKTDTGKPLKIASLLKGPYGIEVRQEAFLKMKQTEPGTFAVVSGHTTPELPIRNFTAVFAKPVLKNPWLCQNNALESRADFLSYSGLTHTAASSIDLTPCGQPDPLRPGLQYNPETTKAATKTDLDVSITRQEGDQTAKRIALTLPPGWASDALTKPTCKYDQAERSACTPESQIGTIKAKATIFKSLDPVVVDGGKVFHCERKGDDAGGICVDIPLPEIAGGGSLKLKGRILVGDNARKIQVVVDGVPTSIDTPEMQMEIKGSTTPSYCSPTEARATVTGEADTEAQATSPYQSTGCDSLNFGPGLNVTHSSTEIERPTSIKTTITNSEGDATMEKINLLFPKELKIDVFKLKSCSPAQRQTSSCPSESHLGKIKIETPYLPNALEGDLHFGEAGRIYFDLSGLVKISLDGQIGIDQKSGALSFTMADIPPLLVSRAEITLDEDKVKNPKECSQATYKATFTSHSGKTSSSESSVDICGGKKPTGEPDVRLKAKLRPAKAGTYPVATFTITQPAKEAVGLKGVTITLGKGKRSLRATLKRARKVIGKLTLRPFKGKAKKVRLRANKGRIKAGKKVRLTLKGRKLKLTGLPGKLYRQIVIKIDGRKGHILRNPRQKGAMTFKGNALTSTGQKAKLLATVKIKRR